MARRAGEETYRRKLLLDDLLSNRNRAVYTGKPPPDGVTVGARRGVRLATNSHPWGTIRKGWDYGKKKISVWKLEPKWLRMNVMVSR